MCDCIFGKKTNKIKQQLYNLKYMPNKFTKNILSRNFPQNNHLF